MICLPLYSFCFPFSPIDTETIRPAALLIYVLRCALLNPSSSRPSLSLPAIHSSTIGYLYRGSIPTALQSILLGAGGNLALSEFVWLRKITRGLSKMRKRDAEKRKRQRERRKAANYLRNSENVSQDIANSTMDAKGVLFSAIEPISLHGLEISNCCIWLSTRSHICI